MYRFRDYYNNQVKLSFENHPFSGSPKHVWVVCRHKDVWLLTKHRGRGFEFPGGKVEPGETAEEAAVREVKEETGGEVTSLEYIGQYHVTGKHETVIKNVYFAEVGKLQEQKTYYETDGPMLLETIPHDVKHNSTYSFIMKDGVLDYCLEYIKNRLVL
ncbi:RNA deprotection pyrophosphohydrolase [Lentibacillus sediminis]|uniref:RNA deprotection pyrophosphohydrolase n=1 Tax=Lentibacillus sediminis TaxID=1940529 RepID=UPI000C1B8589|nr:nucleoside triphosphatase YtkD [Lentibacillus sediminis]